MLIALVLASGLVEGLWTNRWHQSREIKAAVDRLQAVPMVVGAWKGRPLTISHDEVEGAAADGYLVRSYSDPATGAAVSVLVLCGRPGPMSTHTPDICYVSSGYEMESSPLRWAPGPGLGEFWTARFGKPRPDPSQQTISWSWNAGQGWKASDNPRLRFASATVLHKLYIVQQESEASEGRSKDVTRAFLRAFLPELDRALFPSTERSAEASGQ